MRTVFEILPASFIAENCILLCEVGNEGFSFCIKEEETESFLGLGIYHCDKKKPSAGFPIALQIIFHQKEFFSKKFKKVCIVYSFPESVLIPFSLYSAEKKSTLMNMMFGDLHANETIFIDIIGNESMYNCYRVPAALYEVMKEQFPQSVSMHQYSALLKNAATATDQLSVIFYTEKVIVCLVKDGKCQLVNSFNYHTPEDVSYILLNILHQFNLENVPLKISGLLEEKSALYKEIYKYFQDIELEAFREGYQYSDEIRQFPAHYFSYIFAIDSCE
jgi:hypothetical protein